MFIFENNWILLLVFQNKDKLEKLRVQAETFCQRLGRYRMPFAWATVNIMDVISTAAIDRDVTDSDSLKGGVSLCVFVLMSVFVLFDSNTMWWLCIVVCVCILFDIVFFPGKSSSIDRKAQLPRRNSERYNTIDDQFCNVSAFKPATITINTIFKQVKHKETTISLKYMIQCNRQTSLWLQPGLVSLFDQTYHSIRFYLIYVSTIKPWLHC